MGYQFVFLFSRSIPLGISDSISAISAVSIEPFRQIVGDTLFNIKELLLVTYLS